MNSPPRKDRPARLAPTVRCAVQEIEARTQRGRLEALEKIHCMNSELEQRLSDRTAQLDVAHKLLAESDARLKKIIAAFSTVLRHDFTERRRAKEERRTSREEFRALVVRVQAAREEERTHAAREIHDVLAQELTGLKMEVAWLSRRLAEPKETWRQKTLREKVDVMMELTDHASRSVQRIASDLRPVVLDSLGLCAAIEWVATDFQKRTEIGCQALVPNHGLELDQERSTALFRILQESLTNISRHAQAAKVEIHLWQEAEVVFLTVCDNGRGIQPEELKDPRSLGLLGMRERASLLDGRCAIRTHDGGGTLVEVRLPMVKPDEKV